MITITNYVKAQSIEEAYQLNQKNGSCILGGMLWTKMMNKSVNTAIDLSGLGLDKIEESENDFSIGAMVTLRQIEKHEGLNSYSCGAVSEAVKNIVGVQFRNLATVGGSIWGRYGFSDVLTIFLAMDTYVELYQGGIVALSDFVNMEYDKDLLVRIIVKKQAGKFVYDSIRNQSTDFPVIACAVAKLDGKYRITVGARPARACLVTDEEGILQAGISKESAKAFADWLAEEVPTDSNMRGTAEYRTRLIHNISQRLLLRLVEELGEVQ